MKHVKRDGKWILVLLLGLGLIVGGCGDDDDDDDGGSNPKPTRTNTRPAGPTRTPTATRTPGGVNPTPTRGGGSQQGLETVEAIIASILPTISSFSEFAALGGVPGAGGGGQISIPVPCPAGGTLQASCSGNKLDIDFNNCRVGIPGGPSTLIDGDFEVSLGGSCFSPNPNGAVAIDFVGRVETVSPQTNQPLSLSFDLHITNTPRGGGVVESDIDGTVETGCVGEVTIETREPIVTRTGADCPTGGLIYVSTSEVQALVRYTGGGGLEIDLGADGSVDETFESCLDADSGDC